MLRVLFFLFEVLVDVLFVVLEPLDDVGEGFNVDVVGGDFGRVIGGRCLKDEFPEAVTLAKDDVVEGVGIIVIVSPDDDGAGIRAGIDLGGMEGFNAPFVEEFLQLVEEFVLEIFDFLSDLVHGDVGYVFWLFVFNLAGSHTC